MNEFFLRWWSMFGTSLLFSRPTQFLFFSFLTSSEWMSWFFFVIAFLMIVRLLSNKRDLFARAWYQSWGKNPWLGKCPSAWNGNHSSSSSSVSKWFHNVEISGFTWNQFWSFWSSKICHFDHIVQTTVFDILKSAKIDFTKIRMVGYSKIFTMCRVGNTDISHNKHFSWMKFD